MEINTKTNFDGTPIFFELFKTHTYIRTLGEVLLSEEQREEFNVKYNKNFKDVLLEFIDEFPGIITDAENLKSFLEK